MRLFIDNVQLSPSITLSLSKFLSLGITWEADPEKLYTLMVYDIHAPQGIYLHFLVTNIPGNDITKGNVLASLQQADPATGVHNYYFDIYEQSKFIRPVQHSIRTNFNVNTFAVRNSLQLIDRDIIAGDANTKTFYLTKEEISEHVTFNPLFREDTILTPHEQKYCSCVLDVAAKQPGACNLEKAWFEHRDEAMCYNPYAVCAKSVGTSTRHCGEEYNYENLSDNKLIAFINLNGMPTPSSYDRENLLNLIYEWKR